MRLVLETTRDNGILATCFFLALLKGSVFWGVFFIYFSGFAIDRWKKYIKTIKNHIKIHAVDPQAAADNHPQTPGHNG